MLIIMSYLKLHFPAPDMWLNTVSPAMRGGLHLDGNHITSWDDGIHGSNFSVISSNALNLATLVEMGIALDANYIPDITARQLRLWLVSNGIALASIDGAIASIEDATVKAKAQIEWEYATEYKRDHPLVAQIASALGLSSAQIDQAFKDASKV